MRVMLYAVLVVLLGACGDLTPTPTTPIVIPQGAHEMDLGAGYALKLADYEPDIYMYIYTAGPTLADVKEVKIGFARSEDGPIEKKYFPFNSSHQIVGGTLYISEKGYIYVVPSKSYFFGSTRFR